mgnify:CR=1 FL=1
MERPTSRRTSRYVSGEEVQCWIERWHGVFKHPESYYGSTSPNGPLTYYEAKSDRDRLGCKSNCQVVIKHLSLDEYETFQDSLKVAFQGKLDKLYPAIPTGSSVSWWRISDRCDNIYTQIRKQYMEIISPPNGYLDYRPAKSDIFEDSFCRYTRHSDEPLPNARYHIGINQLIQSYRNILNIEEVEFRIHDTTRYKNEVMHSILICPKGSYELDYNRCPVMAITPVISTDNHQQLLQPAATVQQCESYNINSAENLASILMNENGEYCIIWRPFATFWFPYQEGWSPQWDHLTFGFYLPPNGPQQLPLPLPHWRQDKLDPRESRDCQVYSELKYILPTSTCALQDATGNDAEIDHNQDNVDVSSVDDGFNFNIRNGVNTNIHGGVNINIHGNN